jgi:hypothetical protein
MTYRVQLDLAVAGTFADFLHRSNVAFRQPTTHHAHPHHHHPHPPHHQQQPTHQPLPKQGDYALVSVNQQEAQEASLGDLEMNHQSSPSPSSAVAPTQQVIDRESSRKGEQEKQEVPPSSPLEDSEIGLSFEKTYQSVDNSEEQVEVGENLERLDELSPEARSRVARISFANEE